MSIKKIGFLSIIIITAALILTGCLNSDQNKASNPEIRGENDSSQLTGTEDKTVIHFFWGDGCPHCEKQKPWLEEMENKYPNLEVKMYETYRNRDNAQKFQEMAKAYGIQARGVPATFIGDFDPIVGFSESMKSSMENKIQTCLDEGCINPESKLN